MAADLIFTALLLILPTVLWLVPKTRRNNGNWLIAMKTFPLGIIAAFWVGELLGKIARIISERQEREFEFPFGMGLAISLAAGFLVIILGGLFIKRRFGTEKKYNPGPSVLLFLLFLLPSLFCLLIITYACNLMESDYKGKWQNIWLIPSNLSMCRRLAPCSRLLTALRRLSSMVLPMLITSPVAFIWVLKLLFASVNLSNGKRGILDTT